jgi:cell division protein FtsW
MKKIGNIIKGDKTIIIIVVLLMLLSALLMGSTLTTMALDHKVFSASFLIRQLFLSLVGLILLVILSQTPYEIFYKLAKPMLFLAIFLILLTTFFGTESNEARRWLRIPVIGLQFQTSDFVKIAIIIYIAKIISKFDFAKGNVNEFLKKLLVPTLGIIAVTAVANFSTAFLMYVILFVMLFLTPINKKYLLKIFAIISIVALFLFFIAVKFDIMRGSTWESRFNPKDGAYSQKLQAQIAISNGGILFKPGQSEQKHVLANSYSDYVFAIIAEEYGVLGVALVLALFVIFAYRVLLLLKKQKRTFPAFLAMGIAFNILFQAFLHIVVNIGLVPVTGESLPFVSHGGTAMMVFSAQIGILLNISAGKPEQKTINSTDEYVDEINSEEFVEKPVFSQEQEIEIDDTPFLIN